MAEECLNFVFKSCIESEENKHLFIGHLVLALCFGGYGLKYWQKISQEQFSAIGILRFLADSKIGGAIIIHLNYRLKDIQYISLKVDRNRGKSKQGHRFQNVQNSQKLSKTL